MSIEVRIPPVGESITSGVVSVWHKKSGDYVDAGEPLLTFETDKVASEITAEKAGVLETKVDQGQEVKIGDVVAVIDDQATASAKSGETGSVPSGSGNTDDIAVGPPKSSAIAKKEKRSPDAEILSPAVKRMTEENKIDPAQVAGTGKGGRVTKGDVISHLQAKPALVTDDQEKPRGAKKISGNGF